MEKCEICSKQNFCFICVCLERKLCPSCLVTHQKNETTSQGHRTVNLSHPLIGMMIDARHDVQDSTEATLNIPIPQQIKRLELLRDEHFRTMNQQIEKLKSLMTVNSGTSGRTKHRKSFSLTLKSVNSRPSDEVACLKSVKLVVAGDKNTGKTTLEQCFNQVLGVDSSGSGKLSKTFKYKQHRVSISLSVIPSNGKVSLRNSYFFRAKGMIFLFDLTNQSTLYSLDSLVQEAKNEIQKKPFLFIIGMRFDMLEKYSRGLTLEESKNLATNYSARYYELNLKDSSSVQLFFDEVVKTICEDC